MDKFKFFWDTIELCDWRFQGDDEKVLAPVIKYLSGQSDDMIFLFEDLMSELLYDLDTRKLIGQCRESDKSMGGDSFLYSRCVALVNGPQYYEEVKKGNHPEIWELEFESVLGVAQLAWEMKHNTEFPHIAPLSYETGSNSEEWQ